MAKDKKQFKGQYDDEEVLLVFRKHPVVMRKGLILFMFAILLGVLPTFIIPAANLEIWHLLAGLGAGAVLGTIVALPSWVYWYFSIYIMTDQRFIQITQKGFFHRSVSDIGISHIQSVNYQVSGVQETLLGFGSILIQTYLGDMQIHNVHHPEKITNELFDALREHGDVVKTQPDDIAQKTSHN